MARRPHHVGRLCLKQSPQLRVPARLLRTPGFDEIDCESLHCLTVTVERLDEPGAASRKTAEQHAIHRSIAS
jgi:hypothetical protein